MEPLTAAKPFLVAEWSVHRSLSASSRLARRRATRLARRPGPRRRPPAGHNPQAPPPGTIPRRRCPAPPPGTAARHRRNPLNVSFYGTGPAQIHIQRVDKRPAARPVATA